MVDEILNNHFLPLPALPPFPAFAPLAPPFPLPPAGPDFSLCDLVISLFLNFFSIALVLLFLRFTPLPPGAAGTLFSLHPCLNLLLSVQL